MEHWPREQCFTGGKSTRLDYFKIRSTLLQSWNHIFMNKIPLLPLPVSSLRPPLLSLPNLHFGVFFSFAWEPWSLEETSLWHWLVGQSHTHQNPSVSLTRSPTGNDRNNRMNERPRWQTILPSSDPKLWSSLCTTLTCCGLWREAKFKHVQWQLPTSFSVTGKVYPKATSLGAS